MVARRQRNQHAILYSIIQYTIITAVSATCDWMDDRYHNWLEGKLNVVRTYVPHNHHHHIPL